MHYTSLESIRMHIREEHLNAWVKTLIKLPSSLTVNLEDTLNYYLHIPVPTLLKLKVPKGGFPIDAIEEPFWVP